MTLLVLTACAWIPPGDESWRTEPAGDTGTPAITTDSGSETDTDTDTDTAEDADGDGSPAGEDCDDDDPARSPEHLEICGNGLDDDCDEVDPDCRLAGSQPDSAMTWELTSAASQAGYGLHPLGGSVPRLVVTSKTYAWIVTLPLTGDVDLDTHLGTGGFALDASQQSPRWLAGRGDLDGDGFDDFLVSDLDGDACGYYGGSVGVMDGSLDHATSPGGASLGSLCGGEYTQLGAGGFDLGPAASGDGAVEVVVATHRADLGTSTAKTAHLFSTVAADDTFLDSARTTLSVPDDPGSDELYGNQTVLPGDLDGDGVGDWVTWAMPRGEEGALVTFLGGVPEGDLSTADADHFGGTYTWAIYHLRSAGDLDGDGLGDLIAHQFNLEQNRDVAAVYYGADLADWDVAAPVAMLYADSGVTSVAAGGDVDGDGLGEVMIGSVYAEPDGYRSGMAWMVHGPLRGYVNASTSSQATFPGTDSDEYWGGPLALVDVDGDAYADVLVGGQDAGWVSGRDSAVYLGGPVD